MNFSEWYIVKIQARTAEYPFGGEGPVPYYYKSAELYSTVNFIWGVVFLIVLLFAVWAIMNGLKKMTAISFGATLILLFVLFIHGKIGT